MYIESVQFKRTEDSDWETGLYIGETSECENSTILNSEFQPVFAQNVTNKVFCLKPATTDYFNLTLG